MLGIVTGMDARIRGFTTTVRGLRFGIDHSVVVAGGFGVGAMCWGVVGQGLLTEA